ncbi:Crp/Fnr family transcriptional regulator [Billgrantia endophytica]|uniref:Crp/Fnr family transcriptional regulator n=1 Tax=Billgrantia endophytica TaxID=2033802 RepID=A0A2N7TWN0_9GAMM|nr:Crp/Fnr family transcriptional regulator [Halomonas endophytica]PMR72589.1 Crp/Fnr family transcriptional regulator [Halomonas endophytica]
MLASFLEKLSNYIDFTENERQVLKDTVKSVRHYEKKGVDIISIGERPLGVHLMLKGWACRYKLLEDGSEHIMAYLMPGDMCNVHTTLLKQMDHSIRTMTEATVASITHEQINDIIDHYPRIARALFWSMLVDEGILREWLVNLGSRSAEASLAHLFCELLTRSRAAGLTQDNSFCLPLSQAELSDAQGRSPVHVNRVLKKLRNDGLISFRNKRLTILDWEKLVQLAQFDPGYLHLERYVGDVVPNSRHGKPTCRAERNK